MRWIAAGIAVMVWALAQGAEPAGLTADTLRIGRADTMDGLQHAWAAAFHRLRPALREFLRYVLSPEGQQAIAADSAHFLPLPATFAAQQRPLLAP